jgi:hypothetical protein
MRLVPTWAWAALALLLVTALPAAAVSPVPVIIGPSRDGVLHDLQRVVDRYFGPGRIDVRTGYIGARAGDPDPWMWSTVPGKAVVMTLLEKKYSCGTIGWYGEKGTVPLIDSFDDGLVMERSRLRSAPVTLRLPSTVKRFGFYVAREAGGTSIDGDAEPYTYFSNRMLNAAGSTATKAGHAPWDGDAQMLVYDLSRLVAPDTWLVACEYSNTSRTIGTGDGESDNDYSDILFIVSGVGVTPTQTSTFGRLKALYR